MEVMTQRWTDDRMDDLVVRVDNGFAHVDQRFEHVDQRFEHVDQRFEQVDRRFEQVDARFAQVDKRLEQIHEDNRALRREMADLGTKLNGATETLSREFQEGNKKLASELHTEMVSLHSEMDRRFDTLLIALVATLLSGLIALIGSVVF